MVSYHVIMEQSELVRNRRAYHDYEILETYEAGIVLQGTEIKSLRDHGGNLAEAYVKIIREELWLIGASIAPYRFGNIYNHEERRDRKLLMHKKEIVKLKEAVQQKGLTLVPLSLYFKGGRVKIKIGRARGKKHHDKRTAIIEREKKREMDRAIKRAKF
jgi:SsrA-binding protein